MLNEFDPGVFWMAPDHTTDRPALTAIAGEHSTLVVDAGASIRHAHSFLHALPAHVPPVRYVVLTHAHWDHVLGAAAFDASVIATRASAAHLATMATWAWDDDALDDRVHRGLEIPFCRDMLKAELTAGERASLTVREPDETFMTTWSCDLGARVVHACHVGGDHAPDSCVVHVPAVVAVIGDCAYPNLHVTPNTYTRPRLLPLLDRLLALDVDHYVLGHGDVPLDRATFTKWADTRRVAADAVSAHAGDDEIVTALAARGIELTDDVRETIAALRAGAS